jgi:DNA invertase Pin-like site-specific DNA recombinase
MHVPQKTDHKIQPRHLKLLAYIYIRQSSKRQLRENTGSAEVQRMMREHAIAYGFAPENIRVIEQDQGRTGATMEGRHGFKEMLLDVLAGRVGAIFSSHSSRLARESRASQHLVLCCESTGTLIIDQHGVYDLANENDRFFIGIKGVIDEVELRRIRTLLLDARMAKAKKGEFRMPLPAGYV